MIIVYSLILLWLAVGAVAYIRLFSGKNTICRTSSFSVFPFLLLFGAALRVMLSACYYGHETDMSCFSGWSSMVFENGMKNFYTADSFTDYPPGYMYVLYILGAINSFTEPGQVLEGVILKLPAAVCDLLICTVIYITAKKKFSDKTSSLISAFYLLNPYVITDTSLWGQVDSVYTLFAVIFVLLLYNKKTVYGIFMFILCIFIKPQSLMLCPLLIFSVIENAIYPDFNIKKIVKYALALLFGLVLFVLLSLPFGVKAVISQYIQTIGSYPYATVNAFNIWGAMGKNWDPVSPVVNGIGFSGIALVCIFSTYIFFKQKSADKFFFSGAVLIFGTFMLSTHMHERYAFAAPVLLLMGFCQNGSGLSFLSYILVSASQFFNYAWILFVYETDINKYFKSPVITVASVINIIIFLVFVLSVFKISHSDPTVPQKPVKDIIYKPGIERSKKPVRLSKTDALAMTALTIIYGVTAFSNLGDTVAPQSVYTAHEPVVLELTEDTHLNDIFIYLSNTNIDENRTLDIRITDSSGNETFSDSFDGMYVFDWTEKKTDATGKYIEISSSNLPLSFMEIAIRNDNGLILPVNHADYAGLFDEQSLVPETSTFMNSMYFDEIYHARTAYEYIHGIDIYEWTHPPLGKLLISVGVMIFGMCPFGWRFMGTLFGVLLVPIVYIFAKKMFKKTSICIVGCILYTFDFMHFVQSRLSSVDVYTVTFVILMYMFMYSYCTMSFYDTKLSKTLKPLALSGIFFGLAASCKWNSVYAGVGLAVIFFSVLGKRFYEYCYAKQNPDKETHGISHADIIATFVPAMIKTILWCVLFFIIVPVIIYVLIYIPFMRCSGDYSLNVILENQRDMFIYHSKTVVASSHPFSSKWYEWIIMRRPIWYYSHDYGNGIKGSISAFGNPVLWWGGIIAVIINIYYALINNDKKAVFLLTGYFSQLIFWIPIARTTYIYHYFPMVIFLMLMICNCLLYIHKTNRKLASFTGLITAFAAIALFTAFYPVLTGIPVNESYVVTFLKWFSTWKLI